MVLLLPTAKKTSNTSSVASPTHAMTLPYHQPEENQHHESGHVSPSLTINNYTIDVANTFTYLGCTVKNTAPLDTEMGKRIGDAATCNMSQLS